MQVNQRVGGGLRDLGDRGLIVMHVGPDQRAGVLGLGDQPSFQIVMEDRGGGAGDLAECAGTGGCTYRCP